MLDEKSTKTRSRTLFSNFVCYKQLKRENSKNLTSFSARILFTLDIDIDIDTSFFKDMDIEIDTGTSI